MNTMPPDRLAAVIEHAASESGDATFLEDARSDRVLSYDGLADAVGRWRELFDLLALPPSAPVLIDVADPIRFAVVHLSAVSAGLRALPVDAAASKDELDRLSGLIRGAALVVGDGDEDRVIPGVPSARVDGEGIPGQVSVGSGADRSDADPADPAGEGSAVLFTSGSTGTPKGVELGERQMLHVAREAAAALALGRGERGFNSLPLHHINGEIVGVLGTLVSGATLVLDRRFRRTGFWELLADRGITWLNAVPAVLAVLTRSGPVEAGASLRLIRCASAPLPDHVRDALGDVPLVMSWGMTEGASQITVTEPGSHPTGVVGRPPSAEIRVVAEDGRDVAAGEIGSLRIRGAGVVDHYLFGAAADRFDEDGWLTTGDIGSLGEDGTVTLAGRADDVINRGGEKVYPGEVEEALAGDERVLEAVVVGRPDEVLGAVPVAYVIPVPEVAESERDALLAALYERSDARLARFRRPVEITIVDDLPRAAAGKVQRSRVRELETDGSASAG